MKQILKFFRCWFWIVMLLVWAPFEMFYAGLTNNTTRVGRYLTEKFADA